MQDYEDYAEVNKQLDKMGYNIGTRLIEDFLARSGLGRCADFREVGEVVAKVRCVPAYSSIPPPLLRVLEARGAMHFIRAADRSFIHTWA